MPQLNDQGYDCRYVDINNWDLVPVIAIPHLYFLGRDGELAMQTLTTYNAAGLKKFMIDPEYL